MPTLPLRRPLSALLERLGLALLLALALATPVSAHPADVNWSGAFGPGGLNGGVLATANLNDTLVVGGDFNAADNQPARFVARWYGGTYHPMGAGFNGSVRSLAVANGVLYAAGDFDSSGTVALPHLARWTGGSWQRVGAGEPDDTNELTLGVDGTSLLLFGQFSQVGSPAVTTSSVARWDGSWHAMPNAGFRARGAARLGADLFVAGDSYGATALSTWNGSGWSGIWAFDYTNGRWASFTSVTAYGGEVVVTGDFDDLNGVEAHGIARWNGSSFSDLGAVTFTGQVRSVGADDGKLLVVGDFVDVGPHLATWDGTQWTPGDYGIAVGGGTIYSFTRVGTKLYYGGAFTLVSATPEGVTSSRNAAWQDATGYHAMGFGLGLIGRSFDASVHAMQPFDGNLVIGGEIRASEDRPFTEYGSVVAWTGRAWQALGSGLGGTYEPECQGLAPWNHQLVACGYFYTAGGVPVNNIASWDGAEWHDIGQGFTATPVTNVIDYGGTLIAAGGYGLGSAVATGAPMGDVARWNGSQWVSMGSRAGGLNYGVCCLGVWNGKLVLGSSFTSIGGVAANSIATWSGTTWAPIGAGFDGLVTGVAVHNGELYAVGNFSHSGATALPGRVARWNGSAWVAVGSGLDTIGVPWAIASAGGKLYATGTFFTTGEGATANGAAVWDGAHWSPLGSGLSPGFVNWTVAGWAGRVFFGGGSTIAGGKTSKGFAMWTPPGAAAVEEGSRAASGPLALAPAWPNPARGAVTLAFRTPAAGMLDAEVYDVSGRQVRALAHARFEPGVHTLAWDGRSDDGTAAAAGVYWARVHGATGDTRVKIVRVQ